MGKKKPIVFYFYAPDWDAFAIEKKNKVYDECKKLGIVCSPIDVETQKGVDLSIRYQVRNVPTAVVMDKGKVVDVLKGNTIHEKLSHIF